MTEPTSLSDEFITLDIYLSAHVAPGGPVHDVRGSYAKWFVDHGVGVVLLVVFRRLSTRRRR